MATSATLVTGDVRKCYHGCRPTQKLYAVCSRAFHHFLAKHLWDEHVKDIGRMSTLDEEGDLQLGVCPFCQTTISKRVARPS